MYNSGNWFDNKVVGTNSSGSADKQDCDQSSIYIPNRPIQSSNFIQNKAEQKIDLPPKMQSKDVFSTPDTTVKRETNSILTQNQITPPIQNIAPSPTTPPLQDITPPPVTQPPADQKPPEQAPITQPPVALPPSTLQGPPRITEVGYTPYYLTTKIGKNVRAEFIIGSNQYAEKTGVLIEVGIDYFVLKDVNSRTNIMCDLYSVKFVTSIENGTNEMP